MLKGFISYSHQDIDVCKSLAAALEPLRYQTIRFWCDQNLRPGEEWHPGILYNLKRADVCLFIVSPGCLRARSFVMSREWPIARTLSGTGKTSIIVATAKTVDFRDHDLNKFERCPNKGEWLPKDPTDGDIDSWSAKVAGEISAYLSTVNPKSTHDLKIQSLIDECSESLERMFIGTLQSNLNDELQSNFIAQIEGIRGALNAPFADFLWELETVTASLTRLTESYEPGLEFSNLIKDCNNIIKSATNLDYPRPSGLNRKSQKEILIPESEIENRLRRAKNSIRDLEKEAKYIGQRGDELNKQFQLEAENAIAVQKALSSGESIDVAAAASAAINTVEIAAGIQLANDQIETENGGLPTSSNARIFGQKARRSASLFSGLLSSEDQPSLEYEDVEEELSKLRWRNRYLEGRIGYLEGNDKNEHSQ